MMKSVLTSIWRRHWMEKKRFMRDAVPVRSRGKVLYGRQWNQVLEAQWRQLPDYVAQETNAIVIADVSGSMSGRPLATSIGLAIYFAERNRGAYHNLFMTFSQKPEFVSLRGETLLQKIKYVERTEWGMNTNLQAAFERVLKQRWITMYRRKKCRKR